MVNNFNGQLKPIGGRNGNDIWHKRHNWCHDIHRECLLSLECPLCLSLMAREGQTHCVGGGGGGEVNARLTAIGSVHRLVIRYILLRWSTAQDV